MSVPTTPLLTLKDVATLFLVTPRTIRRWRRSGQFPAPLNIGGTLRWRRSDVHGWLQTKKSG
jgi:excisionase family DNA binding protein